MQQRKYKDVSLFVFSSMEEHDNHFEITPVFTDAEGNEIPIDPSKVNYAAAQSKEHFSDDNTYAPAADYWYANQEEKQIVFVLLDPQRYFAEHMVDNVKELMTTVAHEYAHLTDADAVKNATEPYETELGYTQEETKALWFEAFVADVIEMTNAFTLMIVNELKDGNTKVVSEPGK